MNLKSFPRRISYDRHIIKIAELPAD